MTWHFFVRKPSKPNQSSREVKIDFHFKIRLFERTPGTKADRKSSELWKFYWQICVQSSETSSLDPGFIQGKLFFFQNMWQPQLLNISVKLVVIMHLCRNFRCPILEKHISPDQVSTKDSEE